MADWYRLTVGILPDDGVEIDEDKLARAIGDAIGPWTMLYGLTVELIPMRQRSYPMVPAPGPFAASEGGSR